MNHCKALLVPRGRMYSVQISGLEWTIGAAAVDQMVRHPTS